MKSGHRQKACSTEQQTDHQVIKPDFSDAATSGALHTPSIFNLGDGGEESALLALMFGSVL
jgi:hypothetical protein